MTRKKQINKAAVEFLDSQPQGYFKTESEKNTAHTGFVIGARWADEHPKNPWITDRMPEIKGSVSDAVLLLIDGMFYRVSRLERRKDGSEFWWGVDPAIGEEVQAWMPIPELPKGEGL